MEEEKDSLGSRSALLSLTNENRSSSITDIPSELQVETDPSSAQANYAEEFDEAAPKHVFVLSSAGKPVFSLSGDEQHLSTLMGLIQGLLSICDDCGGDELDSISAGNRRFVFLRRGDLVLVAVSSASSTTHLKSRPPEDNNRDSDRFRQAGEIEDIVESPECESFLRLQLEYMYANILFFLTSKVQAVFRKSPGYDLRGLLGGAESSMRGIIDLAEPHLGRGRMLAGGVETMWMDPNIRGRVGRALDAAREAAAPSALYAIWLCGEKLVSLAQPKAPSHRLHSRDLLLLVNFVATQRALRNAESWTPVCFPRFQDSGHLYAYIAFLKDPAETTTYEGLPRSSDGSGEVFSGLSSDDGSPRSVEESCVILVSVEASSEQFQASRLARSALEARFRAALGLHWDRYFGAGAAAERETILKKFCTQLQALHFYYCLRGRRGGAPCVTQCLSPPFAYSVADDTTAQRRIWGHYVRASLRLRRGSCQEGRVFSHTDGEGLSNDGGGEGSSVRRERATDLFESDPVHSLTYEIGSQETVVSLFGQHEKGFGGGGLWTSPSSTAGSWVERDELHACFPSTVAPEAAYKAAIRLMAIIRRDKEWLFLAGTGAFN